MALRLHSLRLIYSYLVGRKQRVKIVKECSTWQEILFGVPQGSILGLLLLNIHMCDLFFVVKSIDIASYAYNTTPYVCLEDPIEIQNSKVTSCLGSPLINNKLSFTEHVHKICDKASQ